MEYFALVKRLDPYRRRSHLRGGSDNHVNTKYSDKTMIIYQ